MYQGKPFDRFLAKLHVITIQAHARRYADIVPRVISAGGSPSASEEDARTRRRNMLRAACQNMPSYVPPAQRQKTRRVQK
jgi:hypothetical protein